MSESQINKWTIDFAQAKIGLRNLEILVQTIRDSQIEAVGRMKALFVGYDKFADSDSHEDQDRRCKDCVMALNSLERLTINDATHFANKSKAHLEVARAQISSLYSSLGKLRSLKYNQFEELSRQLTQQIPSFLDLFDSYLTRFSLQLRLQQAEFYKRLSEALKATGIEDATNKGTQEIVKEWDTVFNTVMPAVEALKLVNPQPEHVKPLHSRTSTTASDSVLLTPVKWIQSKVGQNVKVFKFSDPRRGFFNKITHPPANAKETVVATFDFQSQTDGDLSFKRGDRITVIDRGTENDPNWWCGELNGCMGLFPQNYVSNAGDIEKEEKEKDPDEYIPKVDKLEISSKMNVSPVKSEDVKRVADEPYTSPNQPSEIKSSSKPEYLDERLPLAEKVTSTELTARAKGNVESSPKTSPLPKRDSVAEIDRT